VSAYYNEIDPFAAQWLRNLIAAGHIAPGDVDERSIEDVLPAELVGYRQCHFFAGIGVWSYALRSAGWPDDLEVWTGSCPCQPFSAAGEGAGFDDKRHLWPHFFHLIEQRQPAVVLGEQVASDDAGAWIDLVHADLEALGYAFGCVPFPAAGVGAPNIRDRAYWVGHAHRTRLERHCRHVREAQRKGAGRPAAAAGVPSHRMPGEANGFWRDAEWARGRDGKWRALEPSASPLVDGPSPFVGQLRAYGNALNAEAARVFIECVKGAIA
jgi:DNA (cytosine-5)-methyltransferase 1